MEPLIAFSIIFISVENIFSKKHNYIRNNKEFCFGVPVLEYPKTQKRTDRKRVLEEVGSFRVLSDFFADVVFYLFRDALLRRTILLASLDKCNVCLYGCARMLLNM